MGTLLIKFFLVFFSIIVNNTNTIKLAERKSINIDAVSSIDSLENCIYSEGNNSVSIKRCINSDDGYNGKLIVYNDKDNALLNKYYFFDDNEIKISVSSKSNNLSDLRITEFYFKSDNGSVISNKPGANNVCTISIPSDGYSISELKIVIRNAK